MADKPILFSGPMVRALLAGTKTQTRRMIKPQPSAFLDIGLVMAEHPLRIALGDRLYVREAWSGIHAFRYTPPSQRESVMTPDGPLLREDVWFWADGNPDGGDYEKPRPAMHMPRWASRLTLTVTDVRVERLQDCSEDDAFAEGVQTDVWDQAPVARHYGEDDAWFVGWPMGILPPSLSVEADEVCRRSYATLWDKINGAGAWASNPWVAAYTFTVERGNIDRLARAA